MIDFDKIYFKSKTVGKLSSESLEELKSTLMDIDGKKSEIRREISSVNTQLRKVSSALSWVNWFPLTLLWKRKIEKEKQAITSLNSKLIKLEEEFDKHKLGLEVSLSDKLEGAFGMLDEKFCELLKSRKVWDITTSQSIDRVAERTVANNAIERTEVNLKKANNSKIQCDYKALHFENANGGDLNFFPQFLLVEKDGDIALIDILEVKIDFDLTNFIECESLPSDTTVVDKTWAKSNKDGSRDKRFVHNYQIPVVRYGKLHLSTKSGLNEVYMFSEPESVLSFITMFNEYKKALASS